MIFLLQGKWVQLAINASFFVSKYFIRLVLLVVLELKFCFIIVVVLGFRCKCLVKISVLFLLF
ncbi:unnamed protein product [Arabidopsis halleri]